MRSKTLILLALSTALAGCQTAVGRDVPERGVASVNVPVVTTADYVFDAAAPGGVLAPGESERLNSWFQGLGLGYGDAVYVDGYDAGPARGQVAAIVGNYGMMVEAGAPITQGMVAPGNIRVVVARRRAEVPGCPNWSRPSEPDFGIRSMSNYGCAVNANIAAQVANPEDLLHGQASGAVTDVLTGTKAVQSYRSAAPTGTKGLQDISTKKDSQ